MLKTHQALLAILVALITTALPRSTQGDSISIVNFSFEDPVIPNPGGFVGTTPGWTSGGTNVSNGIQNFSGSPGVYPSGPPDGNNAAYLNVADTYLYQNLSSNLAAGTYTLTAYLGWRLDTTPAPTYDLQLDVNGPGTILADNSSTSLVQGSFVPVTVTYTATASNPLIGDPLTVLIMNAAGSPHQLNADLVTLTFTPATSAVPEPSSLVLLGTGCVAGLAVALARRR